MKINIVTQGYKYNHILKGDILIDARALINPFYRDDLKPLTGLDASVYKYILKDEYTKKYLRSVLKYVKTYLGGMKKKKSEITVLVMCTGGRHRSVFLATYLKDKLSTKYDVEIENVDINA